MKPDDYTKLLLESSFKESQNVWLRNGAFLTFHSINLGFLASVINKEGDINYLSVFALSIVGLIVSVLNLLLIRASQHYNRRWYLTFKDWVERQAIIDKRAITDLNNPWCHLVNHINKHALELPWPKIHSTQVAQLMCAILILFWTCVISVAIYHVNDVSYVEVKTIRNNKKLFYDGTVSARYS